MRHTSVGDYTALRVKIFTAQSEADVDGSVREQSFILVRRLPSALDGKRPSTDKTSVSANATMQVLLGYVDPTSGETRCGVTSRATRTYMWVGSHTTYLTWLCSLLCRWDLLNSSSLSTLLLRSSLERLLLTRTSGFPIPRGSSDYAPSTCWNLYISIRPQPCANSSIGPRHSMSRSFVRADFRRLVIYPVHSRRGRTRPNLASTVTALCHRLATKKSLNNK